MPSANFASCCEIAWLWMMRVAWVFASNLALVNWLNTSKITHCKLYINWTMAQDVDNYILTHVTHTHTDILRTKPLHLHLKYKELLMTSCNKNTYKNTICYFHQDNISRLTDEFTHPRYCNSSTIILYSLLSLHWFWQNELVQHDVCTQWYT